MFKVCPVHCTFCMNVPEDLLIEVLAGYPVNLACLGTVLDKFGKFE